MAKSDQSAPLDIGTLDDTIIRNALAYFPDTQAIYRFGSHGTDDEWGDSDIDIALLLPLSKAIRAGNLMLSDLHLRLSAILEREVDLLNARQVSTVFQKAIIFGELIYCADPCAVDEFEMLTLSYYQKLNEERAEILDAFLKSGRAYAV